MKGFYIFILLLLPVIGCEGKNEKVAEKPCPDCKDNIWTDECENIDLPVARNRIAYISYDGDDYEIHTMDPDGRNVHVLTHNNSYDIQPEWSPDGKRLVFSSNRAGDFDLWLMFSDGTCQKRITSGIMDELDPAWSPDGTKIAFVSYPENELSEIYVMEIATGEVKRLTVAPGVDGKPAWSPDGTKIAFVSNRSGHFEIYTMNSVDGSDQLTIPGTKLVKGKTYNVTEGVLGGPAWSPDGRKIAFSDSLVYWGDYNLPGIVIINADGSGYTILTPDDNLTTFRDSDPAWSPDGKYIVYMSSSSGTGKIYRIDIETGEIVRLSQSDNVEGQPAWSPVQ